MNDERDHRRTAPDSGPVGVSEMSDERRAFADAAARVRGGSDPTREAATIVGRMTVEERLGCLDGDLPFWPGLIDMTAGGYYRHPWPAAAVPRLGVPGFRFADGPRGAVIVDGTAFPVSMARGAAFDPELEERVGEAIGRELRAAGADFTGAVCLNLLRHPAWGRAQETYGEDPHHLGEMAAAFTVGLQRHVMACMKHFALNSMENARFTVDVRVDERALHEVYLPHFRRVAEAGVASTMSAYNSVNGHWCGEHRELLTEVLRDEWGWEGAVISDFVFGLRDPVASVTAGLDVEMPFRQQRATALPAALESGALELAAVDAAATRVIAMLLRFADVVGSAPPDRAVIGSPAHRELARECSVRSMVLVRNESLLPVDPATSPVLHVVGGLAGRANLGDGGSSDVKATTVVTPLEGLRRVFGDDRVGHSVDLDDDADRSRAGSADLVVVVVGYTSADEGEYLGEAGTTGLAATLFPPADDPDLGVGAVSDVTELLDPAPATGGTVSDAAAPEVSASQVSTSGGSASKVSVHDESLTDGSVADRPAAAMASGGDRRSVRLRSDDEALIAAAAAVSDRVLVVVQCGSAVVMPWAESVAGVLYGWYAGVEGGAALAVVIAGAAEPGGRLPFVVPRDEADLPDFDPDATEATYGLFHGQWLLDRAGIDPHYPFGWGLGYTTWELHDAVLGADEASVVVDVENTGDRAGSTVLFVHAGLPGSTVDRPRARLIGFARVECGAGERARRAIELDWRQLDVRRAGAWQTEPGRYQVTVGRHAHDPAARRLEVDRDGRGWHR